MKPGKAAGPQLKKKKAPPKKPAAKKTKDEDEVEINDRAASRDKRERARYDRALARLRDQMSHLNDAVADLPDSDVIPPQENIPSAQLQSMEKTVNDLTLKVAHLVDELDPLD